MKILVVCGAGASSTFVAMRLNKALREAGQSHTATAGNEALLEEDLSSAGLVLVGPHLAEKYDQIRDKAALYSVTTVLLPEEIFQDFDGTRVFAVVSQALSLLRTPEGSVNPDM